MHECVIRTSASVGCSIPASGTSSTRTSPASYMTVALMAIETTLQGMELRELGTTGVKVSPLCLGAMMFGAWGDPDHEAGIQVIHRALEAGINFIDTADVYSRGESEEIV